MQITSVSNLSYQPLGGAESFGNMGKLFDKLGSALESGSLSDAKDAMAALQKNAPPKTGNDRNPMDAQMAELSQALESGDLAAAQAAYADIKETMAQRPHSAGGTAGGPGGPPPSGAKQTSDTSGSLSSSKVYDKMDLNQDGTVTAEEELLYGIEHPDQATTSSSTANNQGAQGMLDVTA